MVMDIEQSLIGSCCDDHETVLFTGLQALMYFGQRGNVERLAVRASDVVGLLLLGV
jgi:hypothetical protein